jgi:pimeloyl-ACP methyl ester carboxylesterase
MSGLSWLGGDDVAGVVGVARAADQTGVHQLVLPDHRAIGARTDRRPFRHRRAHRRCDPRFSSPRPRRRRRGVPVALGAYARPVLPPSRRALAALVFVALLVSVTPSTASGASPAPHSTLRWTACGDLLQCTQLNVPLDDTVAKGPTIKLAIARLRAQDPQHRIGSLFVNPGGPGASGIQYLRDSATGLPRIIRARFDVVSFDPRGSGASAPAVCNPKLDSLFNLEFTPRDDAGRQALVAGVRALVAQCQAKAGAELPYLSTERAARDMDLIRAALGDQRLSYLGYSYGTYLGALYADRFPSHVRAMVLDGAVDPALDATAEQIQQAQGFEQDLDLFLQSCASDTTCPFHRGGNTAAAYDALRARIGATPVRAPGAGKGRVLNGTAFDIGVTWLLYAGRLAWPQLGHALDAAETGDGSELLNQADASNVRHSDGTYDPTYSAFLAIGCLDGPDVGGLAGLRVIEEQAALVAPRLGRSVINNSLACAVWPIPVQTPPLPHAVGVGPIVVVGNTDDPATPLAWATGLAHELQSGVLLTVNSAMHTAYASGNGCVDAAINRYLINLRSPALGTRC